MKNKIKQNKIKEILQSIADSLAQNNEQFNNIACHGRRVTNTTLAKIPSSVKDKIVELDIDNWMDDNETLNWCNANLSPVMDY